MGAAKLFGLNSLALGLGQPTVPGPFGLVGGAGAEGRRGIKRWVQESPSVQPLITAAPPHRASYHPPTPARARRLTCQHRGRAGAPGPAIEGRKWGQQVGGAPPCIPTPILGTAQKAFLSG